MKLLSCWFSITYKTIHEIHEISRSKWFVIFRVISWIVLPPSLRSYDLNARTARIQTRQRNGKFSGDINLTE